MASRRIASVLKSRQCYLSRFSTLNNKSNGLLSVSVLNQQYYSIQRNRTSHYSTTPNPNPNPNPLPSSSSSSSLSSSLHNDNKPIKENELGTFLAETIRV